MCSLCVIVYHVCFCLFRNHVVLPPLLLPLFSVLNMALIVALINSASSVVFTVNIVIVTVDVRFHDVYLCQDYQITGKQQLLYAYIPGAIASHTAMLGKHNMQITAPNLYLHCSEIAPDNNAATSCWTFGNR